MPTRVPDASRNPERTLPVKGKDRETTPYCMDDARRECSDMRCMLDIGECTGACAIVVLRDFAQRLSNIVEYVN
jgi:hypothetical protein